MSSCSVDRSHSQGIRSCWPVSGRQSSYTLPKERKKDTLEPWTKSTAFHSKCNSYELRTHFWEPSPHWQPYYGFFHGRDKSVFSKLF